MQPNWITDRLPHSARLFLTGTVRSRRSITRFEAEHYADWNSTLGYGTTHGWCTRCDQLVKELHEALITRGIDERSSWSQSDEGLPQTFERTGPLVHFAAMGNGRLLTLRGDSIQEGPDYPSFEAWDED